MTEEKKTKRLKELAIEAKKIHTTYLAHFDELKKQQLALMRKTKSGADERDIERLQNEIKKKHSK